MNQTKNAYVSSPQGELDITFMQDARPSVQITLDLGIPNFTVFSIKFPLVADPDKRHVMGEYTADAMSALLEDFTAFMLSLGFDEEICVQINAAVLNCFRRMSASDETQYKLDDVAVDNSIQTFEGRFDMPQAFVNETYQKVVTAAVVIERAPKVRHLVLTPVKPNRNTLGDAARVIRMFRTKTLKQQPQPLYVILYDMQGRPRGVSPIKPDFKNQLLQKIK